MQYYAITQPLHIELVLLRLFQVNTPDAKVNNVNVHFIMVSLNIFVTYYFHILKSESFNKSKTYSYNYAAKLTTYLKQNNN